MNAKQAIISFSQSEKVKSGLIWCSQCVQLARNLPEGEQAGAVRLVKNLLAMVVNEAQLARRAGHNEVWLQAEKDLNTARVMIDSGVIEEATYHFTQALSQVNSIGQQAMTYLIDNDMFS